MYEKTFDSTRKKFDISELIRVTDSLIFCNTAPGIKVTKMLLFFFSESADQYHATLAMLPSFAIP